MPRRTDRAAAATRASQRFRDYDSLALITSAIPGVRDSGTGFCVQTKETRGSIVTCAHVVDELDPDRNGLRVNGREAMVVTTAESRGIDIAFLEVPDFEMPALRIAKRMPAVGDRFLGCGYTHLSSGQYVSTPLAGRVTDLITIREQLSRSIVPSLLLTADAGVLFLPGNSGAAMRNDEGDVIAILAYSSRDGRQGFALSAKVAMEFAASSPDQEKRGIRESTWENPPPPQPGPIKVKNDPQKYRFGGVQKDDAAEIIASYLDASGQSYFRFDVSVRPVGETKLLPPARFFLHDTFPRSQIQVVRRDEANGFTLQDVRSYGVFTVGCQVFGDDGAWHCVEYDLADLPDLPYVFRKR